MSGEKSKDTTIVIPFALTDFAKALRELIGAFRDLAGLVNDGSAIAHRKVARQRAADLDSLGFPPNGMLRPLRRIADDECSSDDFDELERLVLDSADDIDQRVSALRAYRQVIRENCGAAAVHAFDNLLDGPMGKFIIRYYVHQIVKMYRDGVKQPELRTQARWILEMISHFNDGLIDLHDKVLPPRGGPK